ncbi:MAG: outer membrane beta-barrel protein [Myxococcales bacterium]|nr:outer membrane beta-barrel protein [Myxococcales bacterium]
MFMAKSSIARRGVGALILAVIPGTAFAAATLEDLDRRLKTIEQTQEGMEKGLDDRVAKAVQSVLGNVELHGFIDTTYLLQENVDTVTGNGTPAYPDELSTFSLNQLELRLSGSTEWAAFLAEIEYFQNPTNFPNGANGDGASTDDVNLEQGWVAITPPMFPGFAIKLGKWNAPIGLESLDPPDRMQVTTSMIFNDIAPFNMTGVMVEYFPNDHIGLEAFITNGWDVELDFDRDKTYGARVTGGAGPVGGAFTYIGGKEDGTNWRSVYDGVLTVEPELSDDFSLFVGGEVSYGCEENTSAVHPGGDTEWLGFIAKTRVEVGRFGLTLRYEYLDDMDGFVTGADTRIWGVTVSPSVQVTDNMLMRLEYSYHQSAGSRVFFRDAEDVFDPGIGDFVYTPMLPTNENNTFWVQTVYSF